MKSDFAPSPFAQSPYQRGQADSYYRRVGRPHKWNDGIGREEVTDLTPEEIADYWRGFDDNERNGDRKEWE